VTTGLPDTALADAAAEFEGPLFDTFAAITARQPDQLAVDDGIVRLSYAELHDRALALGARIAAQVSADGLVGVLVPTDALCPVAWLACLAARRPFLPFDPHLPQARNQAIIAEARLAAAIVPATMADGATWLPPGLPRIALAQAPGPAPARLPMGRPAGAVGMVLFTSGSTGRPKGIALHERSVLRRARHDRITCDLGPDDRLLSLHPPPTSAGARDVLDALLSGASLHMLDLKRDGLAHALARLRSDDITICAAVPVVVRAMLGMDGVAGALRNLRIMRLSGDAVMGSDIAALARLLPPQARILLTFGMTEAGVLLERMIDPRAPIGTGRIAAGTPVPGQRVSVEDPTGNPVSPGKTGTLVIRGRYLALGHWVAGGLDTAAFPPDAVVPGDRCYRSGDVVLLRADGMLVPIGRADRQVKINGLRVEPADTEAALRSLSGIADAAVLVHGPTGAPVLVAFAVPALSQRSARDAARLARGCRAALAALLPPQLVPARILVVPAIPLLPSLKPDLSALRALLEEPEAARGALGRTWTRLRDAGRSVLAARVQPEVRRDDSAP
jgi:non-ribosomal peptide synthetase component F